MKDLLIFGRSPFIKKLDLTKIDYNRFDVLCINYPIPDIKVHYVAAADYWSEPILASKTEFISQNTGWELTKTDERIITKEGHLSWAFFSSSLAVNFAILRGYQTAYLGGVDLIENDKPFIHYDGIVNRNVSSTEACRGEKSYIQKLGKKIQLYQLNPLCNWLKYKDIALLKG